MANTPKYTSRIEAENGAWRAEIVRRVSNRKTHVSKSQDGFSSEDEANAWAETELQAFLEHHTKRIKKEKLRRDERNSRPEPKPKANLGS